MPAMNDNSLLDDLLLMNSPSKDQKLIMSKVSNQLMTSGQEVEDDEEEDEDAFGESVM